MLICFYSLNWLDLNGFSDLSLMMMTMMIFHHLMMLLIIDWLLLTQLEQFEWLMKAFLMHNYLLKNIIFMIIFRFFFFKKNLPFNIKVHNNCIQCFSSIIEKQINMIGIDCQPFVIVVVNWLLACSNVGDNINVQMMLSTFANH